MLIRTIVVSHNEFSLLKKKKEKRRMENLEMKRLWTIIEKLNNNPNT